MLKTENYIAQLKHTSLIISVLCFFLFVINGGEKNYVLSTSATIHNFLSLEQGENVEKESSSTAEKSYNNHPNLYQGSVNQVVHYFFIVNFAYLFLNQAIQNFSLKLVRCFRIGGNFFSTLFHKITPANAP